MFSRSWRTWIHQSWFLPSSFLPRSRFSDFLFLLPLEPFLFFFPQPSLIFCVFSPFVLFQNSSKNPLLKDFFLSKSSTFKRLSLLSKVFLSFFLYTCRFLSTMKKIAGSSLELLSALHFNPKACNFNFKFEFSSIKPISTNINQSKSINSKISANKGKLGGLNVHISALISSSVTPEDGCSFGKIDPLWRFNFLWILSLNG